MTKDMKAQVADLKAAFAAAGIELNTTLGKGLTNAALIVEGDYKARLTKGGQVATGVLRASAAHRLIEKNGYPVAQVGSNTQYAAEVELGGPPRKVPFEDLLNWVIRKGIVGRSGKNNRRNRADKYAEFDAALAIQASIEKKGTRPHPALLPALVSNRDAILRAIATSLKAKLAEKEAGHAS